MRATRIAALVVGALILAFFAYGFIAANTPEGQQRSHERQAIRDCREKIVMSNTPGMDRSVASVCERMEDQYRAKWHRDP